MRFNRALQFHRSGPARALALDFQVQIYAEVSICYAAVLLQLGLAQDPIFPQRAQLDVSFPNIHVQPSTWLTIINPSHTCVPAMIQSSPVIRAGGACGLAHRLCDKHLAAYIVVYQFWYL